MVTSKKKKSTPLSLFHPFVDTQWITYYTYYPAINNRAVQQQLRFTVQLQSKLFKAIKQEDAAWANRNFTSIHVLSKRNLEQLTRIPISELFVFYTWLISREKKKKKRDIRINDLKIFIESFQQQSFKLLLTVIVNKATRKILNFTVHFQERVQ